MLKHPKDRAERRRLQSLKDLENYPRRRLEENGNGIPEQVPDKAHPEEV
jgi:hypothetical protein